MRTSCCATRWKPGRRERRDGLQQPGRGGNGVRRQYEGRRVLAACHRNWRSAICPRSIRWPPWPSTIWRRPAVSRASIWRPRATIARQSRSGKTRSGAQHPDFARGLMNLAALLSRARPRNRRGGPVHPGRRNPGAVAGKAQCRSAGSAQRTGRRAARRAPLHGSRETLPRHAGCHARRLPRRRPASGSRTGQLRPPDRKIRHRLVRPKKVQSRRCDRVEYDPLNPCAAGAALPGIAAWRASGS